MALWPEEINTPYNGLIEVRRLHDALVKTKVKCKSSNIYAERCVAKKCKKLLTRTKRSQRIPNQLNVNFWVLDPTQATFVPCYVLLFIYIEGSQKNSQKNSHKLQ